MNRFACQYAIIRFLPYAETGEFANVGVVLACPATGYFGARLMPTKKTGRITGFFEQLDKRIYREAMGYLKDELDRVGALVCERGTTGHQAFVQQMFAGLTRPREALLRFGETRAILAEQPQDTLDKLFATVVERDFADKAYHDQILIRGVRDVLRKANLRDYFQEGDIGNEDLHINVPFVYKRDGRAQLAIKPLDLAKEVPNLVYEVGGRWVDRVHRMQRHNLLPDRLLFTVNMPDARIDRVRKAADEIFSELRGKGVHSVPITDTAAITTFATGATNK